VNRSLEKIDPKSPLAPPPPPNGAAAGENWPDEPEREPVY
jgi:hypothetical protein